MELLNVLIQADDYRLQPGDVVEVRIIGKSDLTTRQPLTPDGTLSLPAVCRVTLQGKTLAESDTLLTTKFATLIKNPQVDRNRRFDPLNNHSLESPSHPRNRPLPGPAMDNHLRHQ